METIKKKEYSWFPENGKCDTTYKSVEEALADAQHRFDNMDDPYEDDYLSPIISIGEVRYFDLKNAVKSFLENAEDIIGQSLDDDFSGIDAETECYVPDKDRKSFLTESTEALFPIVEKYFDTYPEWVCGVEVGQYDLKNKCWINK